MAAKRARHARGRPQGGSEDLVRTILETTLKQLEERGFAGVSVEDVARIAGVNKTSVYRRWPSKTQLVLAATRAGRADEPPFVPRNDLRGDLVRVLRAKVARLLTPHGRRFAQALLALEGEDRDELTNALRGRRDPRLRVVLDAAVARGDLPTDTDVGLVAELLVASIWSRLFIRDEPVTLTFVRKVVDHVVAGAVHATPKKRQPGPSP